VRKEEEREEFKGMEKKGKTIAGMLSGCDTKKRPQEVMAGDGGWVI